MQRSHLIVLGGSQNGKQFTVINSWLSIRPVLRADGHGHLKIALSDCGDFIVLQIRKLRPHTG